VIAAGVAQVIAGASGEPTICTANVAVAEAAPSVVVTVNDSASLAVRPLIAAADGVYV
jgi:hypothetical protein